MTLLQRLDGGYTLENFDGIGRVVKTNSPSNTAFRGFGGPEGAFFIETIMDRISYELELSPLKGKYILGDQFLVLKIFYNQNFLIRLFSKNELIFSRLCRSSV